MVNIVTDIKKVRIMAVLKGIETRFATHIPKTDCTPDYHLIKEQHHMQEPDGMINIIPAVRLVADYQRPIWVTKPDKRNHKQKKEYTQEENTFKVMTTQSDLYDVAAKKLGLYTNNFRTVTASPYLYGADISAATIIKKVGDDLAAKTLGESTGFTVAVLDTEAVTVGTKKFTKDGDLTICSVLMHGRAHIAITKAYLKGIKEPEANIRYLADKYIGDYLTKHQIRNDFDIVVYDNELDAVKSCFDKIHLWKPDFVALWNLDYDITKILDICTKYDYRPEDLFSDPMVPVEARKFKYTRDKELSITAAGVYKPKKFHEQWHKLFCASSFLVVDAASIFYQCRMGEPKQKSYSLDYILKLIIKRGKLKFEKADHLSYGAWHEYMQVNYPLEYVVYNIFDCLGILDLDSVTQDMAVAFPLQVGVKPYHKAPSLPQAALVDLNFFAQDICYVYGTTGGELKNEFTEATLACSGWIIALDAHLVMAIGEPNVIVENTGRRHGIHTHVVDMDIVSAYPKGTICYGLGAPNIIKEIVSIGDIPEYVFKLQNINLSSGAANAVEYCEVMFGFPSLAELEALV